MAFLLFVLLLSCHPDDPAIPYEGFRYNAITGSCKSFAGAIGFNEVNLVKIRETRNAECLHLHNTELLLLLRDTTNKPHFAYETLDGFNFKGTVFDSCSLYFNFISHADFRGADLTSLQYGYAIVKGLKDNHTKPPAEGTVTYTKDSIFCAF